MRSIIITERFLAVRQIVEKKKVRGANIHSETHFLDAMVEMEIDAI